MADTAPPIRPGGCHPDSATASAPPAAPAAPAAAQPPQAARGAPHPAHRAALWHPPGGHRRWPVIAFLHGGRYISTDDAYVKANVVNVSTDVAGLVSEVAVHENDVVDHRAPALPPQRRALSRRAGRGRGQDWWRRATTSPRCARPMSRSSPRPSRRRPMSTTITKELNRISTAGQDQCRHARRRLMRRSAISLRPGSRPGPAPGGGRTPRRPRRAGRCPGR
jgi:hypothetical protein